MPMPNIRRRALAAAALLAWPLAGWSQGRGTVEVLPLQTSSFVDASSADPYGINDRGQVVGTLRLNGVSQAFIWNPGDMVLTLLSPGSTDSGAYAINNRSQVVGDTGSGFTRKPMIWSATAGTLGLETSATEPYGSARSIANTGRIAGYVLGAQPRAARWNDTAAAPQLQGAPSSFYGINDSGESVGQQGTNPLISDAFGDTTLGFSGAAMTINNRSMVVGQRSNAGAFVWSRAGGLVDIGTLGGTAAFAQGLNDAGQVVGMSETPAGLLNAYVWTASGGLTDISQRYDPGSGLRLVSARGINAMSQVVGYAIDDSNPSQPRFVPYRLTLHPDWQGGNGHWNSATNWNWGGTGVADVRVAGVHQVVIEPQRTATVWGAADGRALTLQVGGNASGLATLDLNGGSTTIGAGATIATSGVLRGTGTLSAAAGLDVQGRVQVDPGHRMLLDAPMAFSTGTVRVAGSALQPAQLEVAGNFYNDLGGRLQLQHGQMIVTGSSYFNGQTSLESASFDSQMTWVGGQLLVSFGRSSVSGPIENTGQVIVSNGAEASFYGALRNDGELRVSSGGAANFFGPVSGLGSFTGGGEARFEGGLAIGASPGVATIGFNVTLNSAVLAEIGGTTPGVGDGFHDKIVFNGNVTLLQAPLDVVWWSDFTGSLGDRYDLFDWNGTLTGTFSAMNLPTLADGLVWDTSDLYLGGSLAVAAVPEPSSWALTFGGVLWLLARRRTASPR